jgi:hypothetical protein
MYGVFFCSTSTLGEIQSAGLLVEVVDLGAAAATGIATLDEFYLKVKYKSPILPSSLCLLRLSVHLMPSLVLCMFEGYLQLKIYFSSGAVKYVFTKWKIKTN